MNYKFNNAEKKSLREKGFLITLYGRITVDGKKLVMSFDTLPPRQVMEDFIHSVYTEDKELFRNVMERILK